MPESAVLRLLVSDGQALVTCGRVLVYRYDSDDIGMRNVAIVALTDAGRRVDEVAAVFGLTATYVSMLRGRARTGGSAGLVRRRGRPPKLSGRQVRQAREWSAAGWTQQRIAVRFGVARSVISELLARFGPAAAQQVLPTPSEQPTDEPAEEPVQEPSGQPSGQPSGEPVREPVVAGCEPVLGEPAGAVAAFAGSTRIGTGTHPCRYAGAMLLYPYLDRVGAEAIFATVTGGPARRYDDLAVLATATLGFALESLSRPCCC